MMDSTPSLPQGSTAGPNAPLPPDEYLGLAEEHRRASESVLFLQTSHLAVVPVVGTEVQDFLHRMLSNDVAALEPGESRYATLLTVKGKMVADCHVLRGDQGWWLVVGSGQQTALVDGLSRYVISEDVTFLGGGSPGWVPFGDIVGPKGPGLLAELAGIDEAPAPGHVQLAPDSAPVLAGAIVQALSPSRRASPLGPELRFRVYLPNKAKDAAAQASGAAFQAIEALGGSRGGLLVADSLRMEWATPRFGIDMDESHLPLEADLQEALSFDKGCYVGQEYVVRLAHRGQVNKKLVSLELECAQEALPAAGSEIRSAGGDAVGVLTTTAFSPTIGRGLGMGMVKRGHFDSEGPLLAGEPQLPVSVKIRPGP